MKRTTVRTMMVGLGIGVVLLGGEWILQRAVAQSSSSGSASRGAATNDLQRSQALFDLKTSAQSGHQRAEEIYYIKCWICHNRRTTEAGTPARPLQDLYKRPRLMNGKPVNDETVAEVIRNGGEKMPAYRYSLSHTDIAELLSYLREGKCCFRAEEPPRNPWYRY